jgi:hypothetical protein
MNATTHRPETLLNQADDTSWKRSIKQRAVTFLGGKCCICKYEKCLDSMHFHHVDPEIKEFCISDKSWSWSRIVDELQKCALVCANCHGEIHAGLATVPFTVLLDTTYRPPWED